MSNPLTLLPGYALRRAATAMMAELADRLAPHSLKIADASLLLLVGDRLDVTSSELGRLLDIQRANMVPLLNRLERSGLIGREPLDRKSMAIRLTATGLTQWGVVQKLTAQFERDLLARIPAEHRAHLLPALQSLWSHAED